VPKFLKRLLFWDYPRASWQYDLIVAGILAFIFLTPRELFRDQPRASSIVLLPNETPGTELFFVEPKLLSALAEAERLPAAAKLLARRDGKRLEVYRLTPIYDSEKELKGFMAYARQR
jgi:hypothetical protein